MDIGDYIEVYELLRSYKGPDFARRMVEAHADREPSFISVVKREDRVVGVAFSWQISDPHDIEELNGFPGEKRGAKYIYWPLAYIKPEARMNGGIFPELVMRSLDTCPGASRLSFHRRDRLHIISLQRLMEFYSEEQDDGRRRQSQREPERRGPSSGTRSLEGTTSSDDRDDGIGPDSILSGISVGQEWEEESQEEH
jgi:hypothetical protein